MLTPGKPDFRVSLCRLMTQEDLGMRYCGCQSQLRSSWYGNPTNTGPGNYEFPLVQSVFFVFFCSQYC